MKVLLVNTYYTHSWRNKNKALAALVGRMSSVGLEKVLGPVVQS